MKIGTSFTTLSLGLLYSNQATALSDVEVFTHAAHNGTAPYNESYGVASLITRGNTVFFQSQVEAVVDTELELVKKYYNKPHHKTYNLIFDSIARGDMKDNVELVMQMHQPPDVLGWYAGGEVTRRLIKRGDLEDLHDLFTENNLYDLIPGGMLQGVSDELGHPYAVPTDMYHWGVHYDTRVFARLGLSPPTTWEEFLHCCEVLKNDGLIPITIGYQWLWPLGGWMDYLNMRINGPEFHIKLTAGEVSFTDPRVKNVFKEWKVLVDRGYFPSHESASTNNWAKAVVDIASGQAGMSLMADFLRWFIGNDAIEEHIDWFKFPEIVPGLPSGEDAPTDGYVMPKRAVNKEGGKAIMAHMLSTEIQIDRLSMTTMSANRFANANITDAKILKGAKMLQEADYVLQFYDRDTNPVFAREGMMMMAKFMENPDQYEVLLEELEIKRREFYLGLAPTPEIVPNGEFFTEAVQVNITTSLEGGAIYYTTDESTPTADSLLYEGPIDLATHGRFVIRAVVIKEGLKPSVVAQHVYTLDLKTEVTIGVASASIGIYCSAFCIIINIFLMIMIRVNKMSPAVRATSPPFVILMLFGVIVTLATGIVSSIDPVLGFSESVTNTMCSLQPWTISVGWALAFGSLLAKTYRVIAIFGNTSLSNKRIKNSQLLTVVGAILLLEVAICTAWTVTSPLKYTKDEDALQYWHSCKGDNFSIFMAVSLLPKVMLLCAAVAVSIKTRNYVAAFNESKTIGFAVYNLAFIGGASFALSMVMKELNIAHTVRMVGLNSTCMILSFAIAVKPLFIVYFRPEQNSEKSWFAGSSSHSATVRPTGTATNTIVVTT